MEVKSVYTTVRMQTGCLNSVSMLSVLRSMMFKFSGTLTSPARYCPTALPTGIGVESNRGHVEDCESCFKVEEVQISLRGMAVVIRISVRHSSTDLTYKGRSPGSIYVVLDREIETRQFDAIGV